MVAGVVGGLVVTPDGVSGADVRIRAGRIAELEPPGLGIRGALDARGCYVLPGGVDPHAHLLADIGAATRSAAFGGTTTVISFTLPHAEESPVEALVRARDELVPRAAVDVALHAYVHAPDRLAARDVEAAATAGATGIKLFTAYPELGLQASDRTIYETMRAAASAGLPVLVHCENGGVIAALTDELLAGGKHEARFFAAARPPETEVEAVERVLTIAALARARAYVVHVSTAGALERVRGARRRGVDAVAEACTHHLALDASRYEGADAERSLVVPPLRERPHLEALWGGVRDGTLDTIGSDHAQAPYRPTEGTGFARLPYGFGGVEVRLPVVLALGRARGIALERLVSLVAAGPARAFGFYPRKGALVPGSDADLVVWDPNADWTIEPSALHDGLPDSPYAGMTVRGRVRFVVMRGNLLVSEGELAAEPGGGRFVAPGGGAP